MIIESLKILLIVNAAAYGIALIAGNLNLIMEFNTISLLALLMELLN